jgi:hypothetical protein
MKEIRFVTFHDEQFGFYETWFDEFILKYNLINLPFFIQMKQLVITRYKIDKLKKIGLKEMSFGIQSGSHKIRKIYKRPETLPNIINANKILHEFKIPHFFDIIVGNPYESESDVIDTLQFLLCLKKPFVAKTFALIHLPETTLTRELIVDKLITVSDIEGNYSKNNLSWRVRFMDVNMKDDEKFLVALIHLTGNALVPNIIIKMLLYIRGAIPLKILKMISMHILSEHYMRNVMVLNELICILRQDGAWSLSKKLAGAILHKATTH